MLRVRGLHRAVSALLITSLPVALLVRAGDAAPPEAAGPTSSENRISPGDGPPDFTPQSAPELLEEVGAAIEEKTGWNVVPIPEIILDPNEGNTYGLMAVWLVTNDRDEITYMFAPDVRYNDTKGVFPILRLFGYPSWTRRYNVAVGKSTTKDEKYTFGFTDRALFDGRALFLSEVGYERDSTERFDGFGSDSPEDGESNYTSAQFVGDFEPGVWIVPGLNASYRMRIRRFEVQRGQVDSLPFIANRHPEVRTRGLEPGVYWQHRLGVTWDTRDSLDMPTTGNFANVYVDGADRHVGSATSFVAFGLAGKSFIPFRGERRNPVLAVRAEVDWVDGGADTPFWVISSLGGRRRLRGYGGDLRWVGGLGFRFLVRPQIVAFVDVGYGGKGQAVFTGIDYPF